jgi:hypothetical protein
VKIKLVTGESFAAHWRFVRGRVIAVGWLRVARLLLA